MQLPDDIPEHELLKAGWSINNRSAKKIGKHFSLKFSTFGGKKRDLLEIIHHFNVVSIGDRRN
jgi:hypothetical protein